MHHVLVRDVRVREHDLVDLVFADQFLERRLGEDRYPLRIEGAGKLRRVDAPVDVRNLRRRECNDVVLGISPVNEVEVVKVSARSADEQDPGPGHA